MRCCWAGQRGDVQRTLAMHANGTFLERWSNAIGDRAGAPAGVDALSSPTLPPTDARRMCSRHDCRDRWIGSKWLPPEKVVPRSFTGQGADENLGSGSKYPRELELGLATRALILFEPPRHCLGSVRYQGTRRSTIRLQHALIRKPQSGRWVIMVQLQRPTSDMDGRCPFRLGILMCPSVDLFPVQSHHLPIGRESSSWQRAGAEPPWLFSTWGGQVPGPVRGRSGRAFDKVTGAPPTQQH